MEARVNFSSMNHKHSSTANEWFRVEKLIFPYNQSIPRRASAIITFITHFNEWGNGKFNVREVRRASFTSL